MEKNATGIDLEIKHLHIFYIRNNSNTRNNGFRTGIRKHRYRLRQGPTIANTL